MTVAALLLIVVLGWAWLRLWWWGVGMAVRLAMGGHVHERPIGPDPMESPAKVTQGRKA